MAIKHGPSYIALEEPIVSRNFTVRKQTFKTWSRVRVAWAVPKFFSVINNVYSALRFIAFLFGPTSSKMHFVYHERTTVVSKVWCLGLRQSHSCKTFTFMKIETHIISTNEDGRGIMMTQSWSYDSVKYFQELSSWIADCSSKMMVNYLLLLHD